MRSDKNSKPEIKKEDRLWVTHLSLTCNNSRGQSLVSVMVAVGIMGIIMMSFMSIQAMQEKANLNSQAMMSSKILQLRVERYLSDAGSISITLADKTNPGNVALNDCLKATPNCTAGPGLPFALFDAAGLQITGAGGASPLRYDIDGAPCGLLASPRCIFEVYTTYTAICPGGASPCSNPNVMMKYIIQQASGVTPAGGSDLKSIVSLDTPIAIPGISSGGGGNNNSNSAPSNSANPNGDFGKPCSPNGYPNASGRVVTDLAGVKCCAVFSISVDGGGGGYIPINTYNCYPL